MANRKLSPLARRLAQMLKQGGWSPCNVTPLAEALTDALEREPAAGWRVADEDGYSAYFSPDEADRAAATAAETGVKAERLIGIDREEP